MFQVVTGGAISIRSVVPSSRAASKQTVHFAPPSGTSPHPRSTVPISSRPPQQFRSTPDLDRAKQRLNRPRATVALPPQRQGGAEARRATPALNQCQSNLVGRQTDEAPLEVTHLDGFDFSPARARL